MCDRPRVHKTAILVRIEAGIRTIIHDVKPSYPVVVIMMYQPFGEVVVFVFYGQAERDVLGGVAGGVGCDVGWNEIGDS